MTRDAAVRTTADIDAKDRAELRDLILAALSAVRVEENAWHSHGSHEVPDSAPAQMAMWAKFYGLPGVEELE